MLLELALFFEVSSKEIIFLQHLVGFFNMSSKSKQIPFGRIEDIQKIGGFFSIFIVLRRGGAGYFTFMI